MIARTIIARTIIAGNIIARNAAMFLVNLKLNSLTLFKDPYPPPPRWGIYGVMEGDCFVTLLLLKFICLVFHGENGQNGYILIIFSFTKIVSIIARIDL